MNTKTSYRREVLENVFGKGPNYEPRLFLWLQEDGVEVRGNRNEYISPEEQLEIASAIVAFHEKNALKIKEERNQYIESRKQNDFKNDVQLLMNEVLYGMRSHVLNLDKRGRNRGFTCPGCGEKFSTKHPDHLGMSYTHLYYGIDHSQTYYWDAEDTIDYKSEEEQQALKELQEYATRFTGNYCTEMCASKRVKDFFHHAYPECFEEDEEKES